MTETNETTPSENLDWIRNLLNSLPEMPTVRKDILSIAGFPNWENVHSNILAFYFDENEEHGFGRLFLDSLLELCDERELSDFSSDYTVDREVSCDNNKRIDLLIKSNDDDWAVIIENKIYAELYNSLGIYWKAPKVENKVGIVLSLHKVEIHDKHKDNFINITHGQLLEKVKSNLGQYYMSADDRHLLILKEYIANIENRKRNEEKMNNLEKELDLYVENKDEIQQFLKRREKSREQITIAIRQAMSEIGFIGNKRNKAVNYEHYFIDNDKGNSLYGENNKISGNFRFMIDHRAILERKELYLRFEIYGKNTKHGDNLINRLESKEKPEWVELGRSEEKEGYYHTYSIIKSFDEIISSFDKTDNRIESYNFTDKLKNLISKVFYDESNKNGLLQLASIELRNILEQEELNKDV